jgi:hypothetical protein
MVQGISIRAATARRLGHSLRLPRMSRNQLHILLFTWVSKFVLQHTVCSFNFAHLLWPHIESPPSSFLADRNGFKSRKTTNRHRKWPYGSANADELRRGSAYVFLCLSVTFVCIYACVVLSTDKLLLRHV